MRWVILCLPRLMGLMKRHLKFINIIFRLGHATYCWCAWRNEIQCFKKKRWTNETLWNSSTRCYVLCSCWCAAPHACCMPKCAPLWGHLVDWYDDPACGHWFFISIYIYACVVSHDMKHACCLYSVISWSYLENLLKNTKRLYSFTHIMSTDHM